MRRIIILLILTTVVVTTGFSQQLESWKEGYMDIHHINTGRGDCTFCILPDGTTLLIDAGENNRTGESVVSPKPDASKSAGEWIANYIASFIPSGKKYIDYYLLTHYHADHIGAILQRKESEGRYYLTGITDVYQTFPAQIIVDRGEKVFPPAAEDICYANYQHFAQAIVGKTERQTFEVGTNKQFGLRYDRLKYPSFNIWNIYANGMLSRGAGVIDTLFSNAIHYKELEMPRENMYSCVVKLTYGAFSYYTGGDIPGYPRQGRPAWHDIETPVADVVGKVDVAALNHHGYKDTTNEHFLQKLSPRNIIMTTWDMYHPVPAVLERVLSKEIYPEERNVIATNLHPAARKAVGGMADMLASSQGHIVVRVYPGGEQYRIFILDDSTSDYQIQKDLGIFKCLP